MGAHDTDLYRSKYNASILLDASGKNSYIVMVMET